MDVLNYVDDGLEEISCLEITGEETQAQDEKLTIDNVNSRYKSIFLSLREVAEKSKTPKKHAIRFVFNVILDLERENNKRLEIKELFKIYCEKGSKYWLNPMDQLKKLDEILGNYGGVRAPLFPFVKLIKEVASSGLSPESFLRYVVMPRMEFDFNYRDWEKNHLEVLYNIFNIIKEIKQSPAFESAVLGTDNIRLARDVVLIKYIGRPLAFLQAKQFKDKSLIDRYIMHCRNMVFKNSLSVYFLKYNTIHFLSAMSGRIELFQIVEILEKTEKITLGLQARSTEKFYSKIIENHNFNLYGLDIVKSLSSRLEKGYKISDLIKEFGLYLSLIKSLLNRSIGLYLCKGFVKDFSKTVNFEKKSHLLELSTVLRDSNSIHFFAWHRRKMSLENNFKHFIDALEENNGCHPEYPRIEDIFTVTDDSKEHSAVINIINKLNIPIEILNKVTKSSNYSFRDIINAYILQFPGKEPVIRQFQDDCVSGRERSWLSDDIKQFDGLGTTFHTVLMRSVIRGIGRGYALSSTRSSTLHKLKEKYGEADTQPFVRLSSDFCIPRSDYFDQDKIIENEIRAQINLTEIENILENITKQESKDVNSISTFIRNELLSYTEPIENAQNTAISIGEKLSAAGSVINNNDKAYKDNNNIEALKKSKLKAEKQLEILNKKRSNLDQLSKKFGELPDIEKIIAGIYFSSSENNRGADLQKVVLSLIIEKYSNDDGIKSRIDFLKDDIIVDIISFTQFNYILNTLETLIQTVMSDPKVQELFDNEESEKNNSEFIDLIRPFLITRTKKVNLDSLEAGLKKITAYNKLIKVRSNWQSIYDSINTKKTRYYNNYKLYTSKCFIDSYYGDMGGICLSGYPELVKNPAFHNIRLINSDDKQIIGMAILFISRGGIKSQGIKDFIYFFAINPLHSVLVNLSTEKQFLLYMEFRKIAQEFSRKLKIPIVIPGVSSYGVISNNKSFNDLILDYEKDTMKSKRVFDAKGLSLYYDENAYSDGLVIM